jgi:hypothetical protein
MVGTHTDHTHHVLILLKVHNRKDISKKYPMDHSDFNPGIYPYPDMTKVLAHGRE